MITTTSRLGLAVAFAVASGLWGCADPSSDSSGNEGSNPQSGTDEAADSNSGVDGETDPLQDPACVVDENLATVCRDVDSRWTGGELMLDDGYNYTFSSDLAIKTIPVPGNTNLLFDWSNLTVDFLGKTVDPLHDIDMILLSVWQLPKDELARQINDDVVSQSDNMGLVTAFSDDMRTQAYLLDFNSFRNEVPDEYIMGYFNDEDPLYDPDEMTHLIMAATGEVAGEGSRMLSFMILDSTSTTETVEIADDGTTMTYDVDLKSLSRVPIPAGDVSDLSVNWIDVMTTSTGREFAPNQIVEAVIAQFATWNACDMEDNFLQLVQGEDVADNWYVAEVEAGTSISFGQFADARGHAFEGVTDEGTWILALFCGICRNPAPWFLTILSPCGVS